MSNLSSSDPYAAVLADLEAKRDQIIAAIETIKAVRGPLNALNNIVLNGVKRGAIAADAGTVIITGNGLGIGPSTFKKLSVPHAALKYLSMRQQPASHAEINQALKDGNQSSSDGKHFGAVLYSALTRLKTRGIIARELDNRWGLAEWNTTITPQTGQLGG